MENPTVIVDQPCPHCGISRDIRTGTNMHGVYRFCKICGSRGPQSKNEEDAKTAWNARVIEDHLRVEIADLRVEILKLSDKLR